MSMQNTRRRIERGILGIPKKKFVLFSFNPRQGEECLSDSEDSDYYPGRRSTDDEEEQAVIRKAKRKISKVKKNSQAQPHVERKRRKKTLSDCTSGLAVANGSNILQCFPPEILMKIFHFGLQAESVVTFIKRVSLVCRNWNEVAMDPMLWNDVDLPFHIIQLTRTRLDKLLRKDVSCCRILNLSGQIKLSEQNVENVLRAMPSLLSLDLSDCYGIKQTLLTKISELCPQLQRFKLRFTEQFNRNISASSLETFIQRCGKNLRELRLARIMPLNVAARQIFTAIEENCQKLEILDLCVTDVIKSIAPGRRFEFDADTFFQKLPGLSELHLDGFNIVKRRRVDDGLNEEKIHLKNLRVYSHGHQFHDSADHPIFYRMFGSTSKLEHLDISGSNLLPGQIVLELKEVQELMMNDMRWKDSQHHHIGLCIDMWKLTLRRLELSQNIFMDSALDEALLLYSGDEETYPLQYLNLRSTNVTISPLLCVIENCKDLREVDLTSCRDLPRGCKRLFMKSEFPLLIKNLKQAVDDEVSASDEDSSE